MQKRYSKESVKKIAWLFQKFLLPNSPISANSFNSESNDLTQYKPIKLCISQINKLKIRRWLTI